MRRLPGVPGHDCRLSDPPPDVKEQAMRSIPALVATLALLLAGCAAPSEAPATNQGAPAVSLRKPDVPYEPSSPQVVAAMLDLARVTRDDIVYDLGSGDGRIPIMAAQRYGARGVGIDI